MTALTTTIQDDEARQTALLKAVGLDKASPEQRELAVGIANRYGLDLMLKHLVLIDGRPYITRDGLLHIAHKSGQFDGMETTDPVLGEDGFWRSTASIFRKDMSRPFRFTGRYSNRGRNTAYAPEMAIKVGEVMALRRAFDVAAPVVEERWAEPEDGEPAAPEPASLTERIAARAESIQTPEPSAPAQSTETDPEPEPEPVADPEPEQAPDPEPEPVVVSPLREPDPTPTSGSSDEGLTLDQFAELVKDEDKNLVKSIAKRLFPDAKAFKDLTPDQLALIVEELAIGTQPNGVEEARFVIPSDPEPPSVANGGIKLCGEQSPFSEATCTQDAGHPKSVPHRAGLKETW